MRMGVLSYTTRRILQFIPLILIVSFSVYFLMRLAPGDPIKTIYGMMPGRDYDPKDVERIREMYGLNDPILTQYLRWLWDFLHGNLGFSYKRHTPVAEMIMWRLANTFKIQIAGLIISVLLSLVIGVTSAVKQYSKLDEGLMVTSLFLWSVPNFWFSLMMIFLFSIFLGWFPTHGLQSMPGAPYSLSDEIWHLTLPILTLGLSMTGYFSRLVRSSMLEVLRQDYIVTARSKGLRERVVIYKHALGNAMLPVVTVLGIYFSMVFSGAAVVESVFAIPGVGSLMVSSVLFRDYSTMMGIIMVSSLATMACILLTDILYSYLDPRIQY